MRVKLQYDWFAPSEEQVFKYGDKVRKVSGTMYHKGEHILPDNLRSKLPKSAKILTDTDIESTPPKVANKGETLRDFDEARANSDAFSKIANKVR